MTKEVRDAPQFYLTAPSPCPYLPGREERKVFAHLPMLDGALVNDSLTQGGFRQVADSGGRARAPVPPNRP